MNAPMNRGCVVESILVNDDCVSSNLPYLVRTRCPMPQIIVAKYRYFVGGWCTYCQGELSMRTHLSALNFGSILHPCIVDPLVLRLFFTRSRVDLFLKFVDPTL